MENRAFLSRPHQLEQKLAQWKEQAGDRLRLDYEMSYSGHKVYGITLSDWSVPQSDKVAVYAAQPHAHEPATTAGMIDVIEQLVFGRHTTGSATSLDVEKVLAKTIVTFNPIGNPLGSDRSRYDYYDGSQIPNERFWCIMFGEDPDRPGKQWHRYDVFDTREVKAPDPIGIVYEPVDDFRHVEPNRSQLSSYSRLFRRMDAQYRYLYWLDLHQTEFVNSPTQCCILLPLKDAAPQSLHEGNVAWAEEITQAWQEAGYTTISPKHTSYTGVQAEYFRQNWGKVHQRMNRITTEVKNNGADFPADKQMAAEALAIETTLRRLIG
ncbi:hypothetical protein FE784_12605 [Paenibacillus hemerocallicola]|uniref:Peptidase M14 carboxypeptidase A domain-containing protein n=1 Tax=Paenibacillus hemerocallicola TaxID=1172614 RepID=A0A5C4TC23_9BACL|nr:hypothetical protein [Paenibacillus hemerocallicola]TNJ66009.1 hypothetical protein FE784_12605 [Paenibacillus hemerocallicola]